MAEIRLRAERRLGELIEATVLGLALWFFVLKSGVHATLAGRGSRLLHSPPPIAGTARRSKMKAPGPGGSITVHRRAAKKSPILCTMLRPTLIAEFLRVR